MYLLDISGFSPTCFEGWNTELSDCRRPKQLKFLQWIWNKGMKQILVSELMQSFEDALFSYFWLDVLDSNYTLQNMMFLNYLFINTFLVLQWALSCTSD